MANRLSAVNTLVKSNVISDAQTPVALTSGTDYYIPAVGRTMLIGITPAAKATIHVYAGDGVAAMNDIEFTEVPASKISFIQLDTSSFERLGDKSESYDDGDEPYIKLKVTASGGATLVACNAL